MQKSCSRKKKTITNSFTLPLQKTNFLMNMTTFSSPKILRQNSLMVEAISGEGKLTVAVCFESLKTMEMAPLWQLL